MHLFLLMSNTWITSGAVNFVGLSLIDHFCLNITYFGNMGEWTTCNVFCPFIGCKRTFSFKQTFSFHLHLQDHGEDYRHRKFPTQICDCCRTTLPTIQIEGHLKRIHGVLETIKCRGCPLVYSLRKLLVELLFRHRNTGMFLRFAGTMLATSLIWATEIITWIAKMFKPNFIFVRYLQWKVILKTLSKITDKFFPSGSRPKSESVWLWAVWKREY